jgi:hypothetical protein
MNLVSSRMVSVLRTNDDNISMLYYQDYYIVPVLLVSLSVMVFAEINLSLLCYQNIPVTLYYQGLSKITHLDEWCDQ